MLLRLLSGLCAVYHFQHGGFTGQKILMTRRLGYMGCVQPHRVPARLQARRRHLARRALALGPGHVDGLERPVRLPQQGHQAEHAVEFERVVG